MFCPNCGNENRDGSKACAFCGRTSRSGGVLIPSKYGDELSLQRGWKSPDLIASDNVLNLFLLKM